MYVQRVRSKQMISSLTVSGRDQIYLNTECRSNRQCWANTTHVMTDVQLCLSVVWVQEVCDLATMWKTDRGRISKALTSRHGPVRLPNQRTEAQIASHTGVWHLSLLETPLTHSIFTEGYLLMALLQICSLLKKTKLYWSFINKTLLEPIKKNGTSRRNMLKWFLLLLEVNVSSAMNSAFRVCLELDGNHDLNYVSVGWPPISDMGFLSSSEKNIQLHQKPPAAVEWFSFILFCPYGWS